MTNPDTEQWDHRMERAINDLNRNTSKIKQAFLSNEIWKLKMDHEQSKMRSDTLEHDLKMHIIDLKMKISKLKAEKEQEKGTKEVVWRDACLLTTKCQQLEKMLADKDEQYVVLKNANDDLMDLKNQQENDMKNQYKSVVAENKQVVAENKKLVAENKQGAAENKQVVAKNKKVVAKNKHQKDMIGDLKATLKTAMDGNAKLKDRNAQLCSGIMSDMVTNDFKSMLSSFGYHANTSCEEFQSKDEYDKLRADMDQLGRVVNATGEKWKAMQSPPREREPPRKETCLNDDFQGSPELPPRRPSVVGSYVKDVDHDDDSTDEESKDASSQDESKDASDQDESSDDQPDKRRKF